MDEKLRVLLTEVNVDGESLYELNAIGQIYLTGFRLRNPAPISLVDASERKEPTFRPDHYPQGFKAFVYKVWHENPWIVTAYSMHYGGQASIKGIGFYVEQKPDEARLVGTYRSDFGARFGLRLTDESQRALTWAADYLNRKYRP